jgi:hypothetical protein
MILVTVEAGATTVIPLFGIASSVHGIDLIDRRLYQYHPRFTASSFKFPMSSSLNQFSSDLPENRQDHTALPPFVSYRRHSKGVRGKLCSPLLYPPRAQSKWKK